MSFRGLFSTEKPAGFEQIISNLKSLIKQLFAKEDELKSAADVADQKLSDKTQLTLEHKKYGRLHTLCNHIREVFNDHEQYRANTDDPDFLNAKLIYDLYNLVDDTLSKNRTTFNQHRKAIERKYARDGIRYVTQYGASVPGLAVTSATGNPTGVFCAGLAIIVSVWTGGGRVLGDIISQRLGLDDEASTATVRLLEQLCAELVELKQSEYYQQHMRFMTITTQNTIDDPSDYICPITQEVMKDPVKFVDGYSYEREAITNWLQTSRTSPMTREELAPNVNIASSLTPNVQLKSKITQYLTQSQLAEAVSVAPKLTSQHS